jgi:hypothetical protein
MQTTAQRILASIDIAASDRCSVSNPYGKLNDLLVCLRVWANYFGTADIG